MAAGLGALLASPATARVAPVRVLIYAPVAATAQAVMSQTTWEQLVVTYVDAHPDLWNEGPPTLADCRGDDADFMVAAPFELRPRLPGMPNSGDRTAAMTHLVFTNCITGRVVYDQHIGFESDPFAQPAGDFEPVPGISWVKSVPAALKSFPIYFPAVSRLIQVSPPFALVNLNNEVAQGEKLYVYAAADRKPKGPIELIVTQITGRYAEVIYSNVDAGSQPKVGDYVEPAPRVAPSRAPVPAPTPSLKPKRG